MKPGRSPTTPASIATYADSATPLSAAMRAAPVATAAATAEASSSNTGAPVVTRGQAIDKAPIKAPITAPAAISSSPPPKNRASVADNMSQTSTSFSARCPGVAVGVSLSRSSARTASSGCHEPDSTRRAMWLRSSRRSRCTSAGSTRNNTTRCRSSGPNPSISMVGVE